MKMMKKVNSYSFGVFIFFLINKNFYSTLRAYVILLHLLQNVSDEKPFDAIEILAAIYEVIQEIPRSRTNPFYIKQHSQPCHY